MKWLSDADINAKLSALAGSIDDATEVQKMEALSILPSSFHVLSIEFRFLKPPFKYPLLRTYLELG